MRAHVLLYLICKFGISDEMRGLPTILSLFRDDFNKFNNKGTRIVYALITCLINNIAIAFWV